MNVTRKGFRNWLEANPNKRLECGNPNKCAIAQYIADELAPPKTIVSVQGAQIGIYENAKLGPQEQGGYILDRETGESKYRPNRTEKLPRWARRFIDKFDSRENLESLKPTRIAGKTALGILDEVQA